MENILNQHKAMLQVSVDELPQEKYADFIKMLVRDIDREPPPTVLKILGGQKNFEEFREYVKTVIVSSNDAYKIKYKEEITEIEKAVQDIAKEIADVDIG